MMQLPHSAREVLETIENHGGEAYFVGGCVRDSLLGRPFHDWDACTSLRPETVMTLFPKTIPTGIKHGTVTVLTEQGHVEVTTWRTDGDYADHRSPKQVTFAATLEADLSRRDFTVNAMAMDLRGSLTDLFGGRADLKNGIIRCVGSPEQRFTEDALRILRGVRFAAQLGFAVEEATWRAMEVCAPDCAVLSAERVREETEKILCSPHPEALAALQKWGIYDRFGLNAPPDTVNLTACEPDRIHRWVRFYADNPGVSLTAFRLENSLIRLAEGVRACKDRLTEPVAVKRCVLESGREAVQLAARLFGCGAADQVLQSGEAMTLKELAVTGRDFPQLKGPALGEHLHRLLAHVWVHPSDNTRERLLTLPEERLPKL